MLFLIDLASMDGISLPIYKKGGCKYENRKYMGVLEVVQKMGTIAAHFGK